MLPPTCSLTRGRGGGRAKSKARNKRKSKKKKKKKSMWWESGWCGCVDVGSTYPSVFLSRLHPLLPLIFILTPLLPLSIVKKKGERKNKGAKTRRETEEKSRKVRKRARSKDSRLPPTFSSLLATRTAVYLLLPPPLTDTQIHTHTLSLVLFLSLSLSCFSCSGPLTLF